MISYIIDTKTHGVPKTIIYISLIVPLLFKKKITSLSTHSVIANSTIRAIAT